MATELPQLEAAKRLLNDSRVEQGQINYKALIKGISDWSKLVLPKITPDNIKRTDNLVSQDNLVEWPLEDPELNPGEETVEELFDFAASQELSMIVSGMYEFEKGSDKTLLILKDFAQHKKMISLHVSKFDEDISADKILVVDLEYETEQLVLANICVTKREIMPPWHERKLEWTLGVNPGGNG